MHSWELAACTLDKQKPFKTTTQLKKGMPNNIQIKERRGCLKIRMRGITYKYSVNMYTEKLILANLYMYIDSMSTDTGSILIIRLLNFLGLFPWRRRWLGWTAGGSSGPPYPGAGRNIYNTTIYYTIYTIYYTIYII